MKSDALLAAIGNEDVQKVQDLINSGIDINAPAEDEGYDDTTPIFYVLNRPKNIYPLETKLKILQLLLDASVDLKPVDKKYGFSVITCAVRNCIEAVPLLLAKGVQFASPLHEAVYATEEPNSLKSLLISGISVDVRDSGGTTPLMYAAGLGKLSWIKALMQNGADITARNNEKSTALIQAVATDNYPAVEWLVVQQKAPVAKLDFDDYGDALTIWAAYLGNLPMLQCLVAHGASLEVSNRHGFNPLLAACIPGHLPIVRWLVEEKKLPLGSAKSKKGGNALTEAISKTVSLEFVQYTLNMYPAFISESGVKAFNTAAWSNRVDILELLIAQGLAIGTGELTYKDLFLNAAWNGQIEVARWVITKEPNVVNEKQPQTGMNGLLFACQRGQFALVQWYLDTYPGALDSVNNESFTVLLCAVKSGHFSLVKWLVEEKNCSLSVKTKTNETVLSIALKEGFYPLFMWLLEQGAPIDTKPGDSILMWAIEQKATELVKFLLNKDITLLEQANKYGYTPLLKAIILNELDIAKLLVEHGANVMATTHQGEDALLIAALRQEMKIIKWLFEDKAINFAKSKFKRHDYLAYAKMLPADFEYSFLSKQVYAMEAQVTSISAKNFIDYVYFCFSDENKPVSYCKNLLRMFGAHYITHLTSDFLLSLLKKSDREYREWAIAHLRQIALTFNIFPLLIEGLNDDSLSVKLSAIDTINSLSDEVYRIHNINKQGLITALKECGTKTKERPLQRVIEQTLKTFFGENFTFDTSQNDTTIERAIAETNLQVFAASLGLNKLSFNENNTCILGIDNEFSLHLTYEPKSCRLYMYSPLLDGLPRSKQLRLKLYQELLGGSLFGEKMAGGGVGIAHKEQLILMYCTLDMKTARSADLNAFAGIYCDAVEKWRKICANFVEAEKRGEKLVTTPSFVPMTTESASDLSKTPNHTQTTAKIKTLYLNQHKVLQEKQTIHELINDERLTFLCAKNNLTEYGQQFGLKDLTFVNNTAVVVVDNEFSMHMTYEPESHRLYVYSPLLDGLPKHEDTQLKLYEKLLEASLLGGQMAGGSVGLAVAEELILLHCIIFLNKNSESSLLRKFAPLFVETVIKWRKICAECCAKEENKLELSAPEPAMPESTVFEPTVSELTALEPTALEPTTSEKKSKTRLLNPRQFFENKRLNFNVFKKKDQASPPQLQSSDLSKNIFTRFAKAQTLENFYHLLSEIISEQIVDVDVAHFDLSITQVGRLFGVIRQCPWVKALQLGKNLEWASASEQEYFKVRFDPTALAEAKQLVLDNKVDKLITLTEKSTVFYEVFGYTPWHLVALTGNETIIEELIKKNVFIDELDKEDNNPIQLAERHGYRDLAKRLRLIKDEQEMQRLLIESVKIQEGQRNFTTRQIELRQELEQLISKQESEHFRLYYDFWTVILTIKSLAPASSSKAIDMTMLKFPVELLKFVDTEDARKNVFELLKSSRPTKKIKTFQALHAWIKQLEKSLKPLAKEADLHIAVVRLIGLYHEYLERLCQIKDFKQFEFLLLQMPPSIMIGAGLAPGFLLKKYDDILTNFSNQRENIYGSSDVYQIGNIHFKRKPHAPGVEFMVSALGRIIANQGATPTELFKIIDSRGIPFIYLASKSVRGKELEKVLRHYPDAISKIDMNNFSAVVVLGLLTDPQDGKPDNYMVEFEAGEDNRIKRIEIIGIDNDIAFAEAKVRAHNTQGQGRHFINIRNVLYFFPQMNQPIGAAFREHLLKRSPEMIMLEWLVLLYNKNKEYQRLLEEGVFTREEYYGGKTDKLGLQLPMRFLPGTVEKLYREKLLPLFKLLESPNVTLMQLFEALEPALAEHYKLVAQQHPNDIHGAIHSLYKESIENIKEQQQFEKELAYGNTAVMTEVALKTASQFEFEESRSQNVQQAIIAWLKVLNYDRFTVEEAKIFYASISQIDFLFSGKRQLTHFATENRLYALAEFLLKNGLESANQTDDAQITPLHIAASLGDVPMLELLYTHGAILNAPDKNQKTPKDKALGRSQNAAVNWFSAPTKKIIAPVLPSHEKTSLDMSTPRQGRGPVVNPGLVINTEQSNLGRPVVRRPLPVAKKAPGVVPSQVNQFSGGIKTPGFFSAVVETQNRVTPTPIKRPPTGNDTRLTPRPN